MEHPGAGAAAAAAGQGTPGTPRGSWCHPPSRHRCGILGALMACGCCCHHPCAQTHPLQHARVCTHCRLLLWARTHLAACTHLAARTGVCTPCSTHGCRGSSAPRHPCACPLPFLAAPRRQEDKAQPRGQEEQLWKPTAPTGWSFWKAAGSGFSPTFPPEPDPTQAFLQGRARAHGGAGGGSEHPAVAASPESPDLIRR